MGLTNSIMMKGLYSIFFRQTLLVLPWLILVTSCTNIGTQSSIVPTPERLGSRGYIPVDSFPNTLAILPSPPPLDSAMFELDKEMNRKGLAFRDTPRWEAAAQDNIGLFPEPMNAFSCSLDAPITEKDTPHLYTLLHRTYDDVEWFDKPLKDQYQRPRPYVLYNEPRCGTARHHDYTSYPSGYAALGMAYALILSEIAPDKTEALIARGVRLLSYAMRAGTAT